MDLDLPEKRFFFGPATIWKRILAFVIDLMIIDLFALGFFREIILGILGKSTDFMSTYSALQGNNIQVQALTAVFTIAMLMTITYFVLLQYTVGQTIGCILLNIYIVSDNKEEFGSINFWQALLRNCFLIVFVPFIFLWIVDPAYLFFAKKGQRFSEWLSGTMVVEQFES